jgi:hypothetical protein
MTTWTISTLERELSDGGVVVAHWRATAVDGDFSASSYGTVGFTPGHCRLYPRPLRPFIRCLRQHH